MRLPKILLIANILLIILNKHIFAAEIMDIQNHWADAEINRLITNRVVSGYPDKTFKPENNITIIEFLKLLIEAGGITKVPTEKTWPDMYIRTAMQRGFIIDEYVNNLDKELSRNEASGIIAKYIDVKNIKESKNIFKDLNKNYKSEILKLTALEVIKGYENGEFRGENNITRAEAAKIINKAVDVRRELTYKKEIKLANAERLTNINKLPSYNSVYSNRYEIDKSKIYFYDNGRYAKLDGYQINEKNIKNNTLIKVVEKLLSEDKYVYIGYVPDEKTVNQIIITYGEREGYIYNNSYNFEYIFYEDKPFELSRIAQDEEYSKECFMKISVAKLWIENNEIENKVYINKYNAKKLEDTIKIIFGDKTGKEITEYILSKVPNAYEKEPSQSLKDIKSIDRYTLNMHVPSGVTLHFYISKNIK